AHARLDLLEDAPGDHRLPFVEHQAVEEPGAVHDRHATDVRDRPFEAAGTRHGHGEDLRLQPGATTGRAGHLPHIALVALLLRLRLGLVEAPLEERHDALEPRIVRADPPESVAVAHPDLGGRSAEDRLADL